MFASNHLQANQNLKFITELILEKSPLLVKFVKKKGDLVKHQATHSEVRSFKCSICPEGRLFKTKGSLRNHMVFHYEPKFACSQCDYKTHIKCNLNRHIKSHDKKS